MLSVNNPSGFIPVCSLGMSQIGRMNLGKDASTFKYYTMCGLQEGFEPFAVNMNREITMWFSKRLPTFVNVPQDHMHIEVTRSGLWLEFDGPLAHFSAQSPVWPALRRRIRSFLSTLSPSSPQVTRIDGTVDSPPCLKVTHKTFGTQNSNSDMLYCRLSMPVEFFSAERILDETLKFR